MKKHLLIFSAATILAAGFFLSFNVNGHAAGYTVEKLIVATGVENKEPVGIADTFPVGTTKVYCFLEARNIEADTEVTFAWIHNGKEIHKTALTLKSGPRWRTRAEKTLYGLAGEWKVEIRDAAGNVLKDISFKVE